MINHFGLDIGSETIKIAQVVQEKDKLRLVTAGVIKNPLMGFLSESEKDLAPLAEAIISLKKEAKVSTDNVVASLPEKKLFTQVIEVPKMTEEQLQQAIPWQAESLVPKPLSEVNLNWQVIDEDKSPNGKMKIFLVAAPTVLVENYQKIFRMAGLAPLILETEVLATLRSLRPLVENKNALIFNFGAESADIVIIKNGRPFLTRSLSSSGKAISRAISVGLSLDLVTAEEYKKTYGLSGEFEGKIAGVIEPILASLANEIKKAISFYEEKITDKIGLVILSGGSALISGVAEYFAKILGVEVQIANPFANLLVDPQMLASLQKYFPIYCIAAGLAQRGGQ